MLSIVVLLGVAIRSLIALGPNITIGSVDKEEKARYKPTILLFRGIKYTYYYYENKSDRNAVILLLSSLLKYFGKLGTISLVYVLGISRKSYFL